MRKKIEIDRNLLYKLYIEEDLSMQDIADKLGTSRNLIFRRLKENDIKKDCGLRGKKFIIDKDLLYRLYIEENLGMDEVAEKLNISTSAIFNKLKEYNIVKSKEQLEAQKIKTLQEKYGQNITNVFQAKEIRDKIKQTNLEKYGVEHVLQSKEVIEKGKRTKEERYGDPNYINIEKAKQTNLEKYRVPYFCMREECYNKNGYTVSKVNIEFSNKLKENNIENKLEFRLDNSSFDIQLLNSNILIEINPTYTHNSTIGAIFSKVEKEPLDKMYHYNKTLLARENNYQCIHIFDWDDTSKIIDMLKPSENIYARKCEIREVPIKETNEFLNRYHLQNTCTKQLIRLGLYYDDELVQIMTFGKPRYNKKYEYELLRLCTKTECRIVGGANKLFKYFLDNYNPTSIISYCDNSKFSGKVYEELGFSLKSFGKPSKHWYNGKQHITDNLLRQRGFDQLFGTDYGKGTSNKELMKQYGFVEVYDSGQSTFIWNA